MAVGIDRKLQSQRGASMPLALLLFLVCAALSAVVLAAGTAAAGRYADLVEADQRYYSVTSAAQLVKDQLNGKAVDVTCTKKTVTETQFIEVNGSVKRVPLGSPVESYDPPTINDTSLLGEAAKALFTDAAFAWNWSEGTGPGSEKLVDTYKLDFDGKSDDAYDVKLEAVIAADGALECTLSSTGTADDPVFSVKLTCRPKAEVQYGPRSITPTGIINNVETVTSEETKTLRVSWTDFEVQKA